MVDVYTALSDEGYNESLYSSYLGIVPDFASASPSSPPTPRLRPISMRTPTLSVMITAIEQVAKNFGGAYKCSASNSSITVQYDALPVLYIAEFISNGTDFRETLSKLLGIADSADLSIRLYPSQLESFSASGSRQAFRAVFQGKSELADYGTPTCVSWLSLDKFHYGGRALDEFVFELDQGGRAVEVEILALQWNFKGNRYALN
ncbi:hypothetical protein BJX65DRAFT_311802 [Aspergillus insuetus]